jgi:Mce-associated membrane protein
MTPSEGDADAVPTGDELARAAEAQAAEAQARADAARARADELRRQLAQDESTAALDLEQPTPPPSRSVPWAAVGAGVAAAASAGLIVVTALMLWSHQNVSQQRQREAEFVAAARQNVVNLLAIDYNTAQDSVQRVLDGSTGKFRTNFEETAEDFIKALQDEKITTTATVNDAAMESMTAEGATVLISATSRREGPKAPKDQQEPRVWRIVLTLERDGSAIKMSGVEFV